MQLCILALVVLTVPAAQTAPAAVPQSAGPSAETTRERADRHAAIARIRQETILLAHRGAALMAPENTLRAIDAAMRLGCGAVEIDFRRTLDGHVVAFHDDRLEHCYDRFGTVEASYLDELRLASLRDPADRSEDSAPIPTLDEVLASLRRWPGMVHVDVKTPGLSAQLLDAFRKADMVDQILGYNRPNSQAFQEAGIPEIPFKGTILETRLDFDPGRVREVLARPGQVVFLDDPRAALSVLGVAPRPASPASDDCPKVAADASLAACEQVLLGRSSRVPVRVAAARMARLAPVRLHELAQEIARSDDGEVRCALAWGLGAAAKANRTARLPDTTAKTLLALLDDADPSVRPEAAVACGHARIVEACARIGRLLDRSLNEPPSDVRQRAIQLDERARCAFALGLCGQRDANTRAVLLKAFRQREKGRNGLWLGADGAMAAWALGKLRVGEAVPLFREALLWQPPTGEQAADDDEPPRAYVYWDLQAPRFLPRALVEIGTPDAITVLEEILRLPAERVGRGSPELLVRSAEALARASAAGRLGRVASLCSHPSPQVRGCAVLQCLHEPGRDYRRLLETHATWAVPWWDAEHGETRKAGP